MDYRDLLDQPSEIAVLPYLGGTRVDGRDRPLRLDGDRVEPGWWRFEIRGRNARPVKRADPPDLSDLPAVRGHVAGPYLFSSGTEVERFGLDLDLGLEPEPLSPCVGRRWPGGALLFDGVEFEDVAEEAVRDALDRRAPIDGIKGVTPGLRAAYAYALVAARAAELDVPIAPRECLGSVAELASVGAEAADRLLNRAIARRREQRIHVATRTAVAVRRGPATARQIDDVLEGAGARLLRWRNLDASSVEVTFSFMGERFVTVVAARTLQVLDAGICLSGADRELTLDSLPSAIREAIQTRQLVITRR